MRRRLAGQHFPMWTKTVLWAYITGVLFLNREVIGKDLTYLLDSYRMPTIFLLGILIVTLRIGTLEANQTEAPAAKANTSSENFPRPQKPAELVTLS
jgi:hypothetical protein